MADEEWLDHLNKLFIYLFSLFIFCENGEQYLRTAKESSQYDPPL